MSLRGAFFAEQRLKLLNPSEQSLCRRCRSLRAWPKGDCGCCCIHALIDYLTDWLPGQSTSVRLWRPLTQTRRTEIGRSFGSQGKLISVAIGFSDRGRTAWAALLNTVPSQAGSASQ